MNCFYVGAGIGFSGFVAKGVALPGSVCSLSSDVVWSVSSSNFKGLPASWQYNVREGVGNAHAWGGVLGIPTEAQDFFGLDHFKQALTNYYTYCGYKGNTKLLSSYLANQMTNVQICSEVSLRKLLVTNSVKVKRASLARIKAFDVQSKPVKRLNLNSSKIELLDSEGNTRSADSVVLCAGAIGTHKILADSGIANPKGFMAEDSFFGRVGRVRLSKGVPTGLFHHHVISKSLRLKTGYEIQHQNGNVLFFLQPAIRGIPASDIQLLKEYLALKSKPNLGGAFELMKKPKLILELLLMEFSMGRSATDFDVYCVLDVGKRWYELGQPGCARVNLAGAHPALKDSYVKFIDFLESESGGVELVDHELDAPLTKNLESAYHLCGSVYHEGLVDYDSELRVWRLKQDERVIINDNSIIYGKGVANPSLGLF